MTTMPKYRAFKEHECYGLTRKTGAGYVESKECVVCVAHEKRKKASVMASRIRGRLRRLVVP